MLITLVQLPAHVTCIYIRQATSLFSFISLSLTLSHVETSNFNSFVSYIEMLLKWHTYVHHKLENARFLVWYLTIIHRGRKRGKIERRNKVESVEQNFPIQFFYFPPFSSGVWKFIKYSKSIFLETKLSDKENFILRYLIYSCTCKVSCVQCNNTYIIYLTTVIYY